MKKKTPKNPSVFMSSFQHLFLHALLRPARVLRHMHQAKKFEEIKNNKKKIVCFHLFISAFISSRTIDTSESPHTHASSKVRDQSCEKWRCCHQRVMLVGLVVTRAAASPETNAHQKECQQDQKANQQNGVGAHTLSPFGW